MVWSGSACWCAARSDKSRRGLLYGQVRLGLAWRGRVVYGVVRQGIFYEAG